MQNGAKRRRVDDFDQQPPPKTAKLDATDVCCRSIDSDEENDLNNAAWQLHRLREPEDLFAHVQNQWRPITLNDPHKNLTFRFNGTNFLNTGFNLRGTDHHFVPFDYVYAQRMSTIQQSLNAMQREIFTLTRRRRYCTFVDEQRLNYLMNYRGQLGNTLERLRCSRESANSLFCAYCAPILGQDANLISTWQKSEAEHLDMVLNNLKSFYSTPQ